MTFTNVDIDLETLPRSADVQFHDLNPRYARVVLGVALAFEAPLVVLGLVWMIGAAIAAGLWAALVVAVLIVSAWLTTVCLHAYRHQSDTV